MLGCPASVSQGGVKWEMPVKNTLPQWIRHLSWDGSRPQFTRRIIRQSTKQRRPNRSMEVAMGVELGLTKVAARCSPVKAQSRWSLRIHQRHPLFHRTDTAPVLLVALTETLRRDDLLTGATSRVFDGDNSFPHINHP